MNHVHLRAIGLIGIAALVAGCSPAASGAGTSAPPGAGTSPATSVTAVPPAATATPASSVATNPTAGAASPSASTAAPDILNTIPVPGNPGGMVAAFGSLWVASRHSNTVVQISLTTREILATIPVGSEPGYLTADGSAVWVVQFGDSTMTRIDPKTGATESVALPGEAGGPPVAGGGAVWQAAGSIAKIDSTTHEVVGSISPGGPGVAFSNGRVLVAQADGKGIRRIDPATLKPVDTVAPDVDASGMVMADEAAIWSGNAFDMTHLDPKTGVVVGTYQMPAGVDGGMSVYTGGNVWLQDPVRDSFSQLDTKTGEISPEQHLPNMVTQSLWFVDLGPHELWVSDWDANAVYRIDPAP